MNDNTSDNAGRDAVNDVLGEISERLSGNEPVDIESYVARYPQYGDRLRRAWPGMQALVKLGRSSSCDEMLTPKELSPLGDYRIAREIGRGGMGVVYEAEQMSLGRRVAIKVLRWAAFLDEARLERFRNEARAAAMLDHPNIVSVFSVGCERGIHFFAMSLIEGQSLAAIVAQLNQESKAASRTNTVASETIPNAQLTTQFSNDRQSYFKQIANLFAQTAHALHYAHQQGVIHRDIKPSNLIVDRFGKPHVTDFGLARILTDPGLTASTDLPGTLRYMSPEQFLKDSIIDHRTDVFSLGLTLYELATGQPARSAETRPQLLAQAQSSETALDIKSNRQIPRDLETIILKATNYEPGLRYDTAAQLAEDLERFSQGKAVLARRSSSWENMRRWVVKNPLTAGLIAVVGLLLLLLASGSLLASLRLGRQANELTTQIDQSEQIAYAHDIRLAQQDIKDGNFIPAQMTLLKHVPTGAMQDRRGFEWYHLWLAGHDPALERSISQVMMVRSLDFLDGTNSLVVGAWARYVRIWDLGREPQSPPMLELRTDERVVRCVLHLPQRDSILIINADGICRELSLTGEVQDWEHPLIDSDVCETICYFAELIDDKCLIYGGSPELGTVAILDAVTLEVLTEKGGLPGRAHVGVVNGNRLLVGCENSNQLQILNTRDLSQLGDVTFSTKGVHAIGVSPDRTKCVLATSSGARSARFAELILWDVSEQKVLNRVGIEGDFFKKIECSPDGRFVAAGQNQTGTLYLFDKNLHMVRKHQAHSSSVTDIRFTSDSQRMVTGSTDGTVHVWNVARFVAKDQVITRLDADVTFVSGPAFLDNDRALVTCDKGLILWNANNGQVLERRPYDGVDANALTLAISDDRSLLAVIQESFPERQKTRLEILDLKKNTPILSKVFRNGESGSAHRAFSRDNRYFVHFVKDRVFVLDLKSKTVRREFDMPSLVKSVAFSPDNQSCVIADVGGLLHQFSVPSFKKIRSQRGDGRLLIHAVFSPNGQHVAAVGLGCRVNLFDAKTLSPVTTKQFTQTAKYLCSVQYTPDGKRIATGSPDGTVRLWDVDSGEELLKFRAYSVYYPQLAFSPDGSKLLIASGKEAFVVSTAARDQLESLSVSELTEIPCQTSISPWRKFEAIPDG